MIFSSLHQKIHILLYDDRWNCLSGDRLFINMIEHGKISRLAKKLVVLLCTFQQFVGLLLLLFEFFLVLLEVLNFFKVLFDLSFIYLSLFKHFLLESHPFLQPIALFLCCLSFFHSRYDLVLFLLLRQCHLSRILDHLFIDLYQCIGTFFMFLTFSLSSIFLSLTAWYIKLNRRLVVTLESSTSLAFFRISNVFLWWNSSLTSSLNFL